MRDEGDSAAHAKRTMPFGVHRHLQGFSLHRLRFHADFLAGCGTLLDEGQLVTPSLPSYVVVQTGRQLPQNRNTAKKADSGFDDRDEDRRVCKRAKRAS